MEEQSKRNNIFINKRSISRIVAIQVFYNKNLLEEKYISESLINDLIYHYENKLIEDKVKLKLEKEFLHKIIVNTLNNMHDIDIIISQYLSEGWTIEKVNIMLITILRLAVSELHFFQDIPMKVIINEYTDAANNFCDKNEVAFVNGILDKIAKHIRLEEIKKSN